MPAKPALTDDPDFAALFPPHDLNGEMWQLAPRTAALLHTALNLLAEFIRSDVERNGEQPVSEDGPETWYALDRLPRVTWHQPSAWRQELAGRARALADDLAHGQMPVPRCTAEEMLLHLAIEDAEGDDIDPTAAPEYPSATRHQPSDDWETCRDLLFDDHDVVTLDEPAPPGIDGVRGDASIAVRSGALRPETWFDTFRNVEPR